MTNGSPRSLNEFDFTVENARRMHGYKADGYVTYAIKGRKRKSNSRILSFYGLFLRHPELFADEKKATVSIGVSKMKRNSAVVAVFNNPALKNTNTEVRIYESKAAMSNSGAHCIKVIESFGYDVPEVPDTQLTILFTCHDIEGQPHVFEIEPKTIIKINKDGVEDVIDLRQEVDIPGVGKTSFGKHQ